MGVLRRWVGHTPFVNIFKSADTWITSAGPHAEVWDTGLAVPLRDDGFPLQIPFTVGNSQPQTVKTLMLSRTGWDYPTGTYTLSFEGDGEVIVGWDAIGGPYVGGGTYTFQVPDATNEGIMLAITRSESSDPVRNIRVILPGYEDVYTDSPYHPDFLDTLRGFTVTRYSEWAPVNLNLADPNDLSPTTWDSRTLPDDSLQSTENGVAWEHIIAISNAVNTSPWITVPHKADDDFIRQLAILLRDTLNPDLKVYLEYSNEVWNSDWPFKLQRDWANLQGMQLGLSSIDGEAGYRYTAKRSAELFKIFEDVFGADADRVLNILAGFQPDTAVAEEILTTFNQSSMNGVSVNPWGVEADMFAIGAYFGGDNADGLFFSGQSGSAGIDQILDELAADLADDVVHNLTMHREMLAQWNLPIVSYEGGQSLWALTDASRADSVLIGKLHEANRNQRMTAIYEDLFDAWFNNGGSLFMHYSLTSLYDQWASFGSLENQDQSLSTAPKQRALMELIAEFENGLRPFPELMP